jgi:hypothetical protein
VTAWLLANAVPPSSDGVWAREGPTDTPAAMSNAMRSSRFMDVASSSAS